MMHTNEKSITGRTWLESQAATSSDKMSKQLRALYTSGHYHSAMPGPPVLVFA